MSVVWNLEKSLVIQILLSSIFARNTHRTRARPKPTSCFLPHFSSSAFRGFLSSLANGDHINQMGYEGGLRSKNSSAMNQKRSKDNVNVFIVETLRGVLSWPSTVTDHFPFSIFHFAFSIFHFRFSDPLPRSHFLSSLPYTTARISTHKPNKPWPG